MRNSPVNKEAKLHRLFNQRRIAYSLIKRSIPLLKPGSPFTRELHELFRAQGRFGSKDRRLYRELIFTYLRYQPWLTPLFEQESEFINKLICLAAPTSEIQSLYPSLPYKVADLDLRDARFKVLDRHESELSELLPDWFATHCNRSVSSQSLLHLVTRPPLWLRIQKDPQEDLIDQLRSAATPEQAPQITPHPLIPDCIHAPADFSVTNLPCFEKGLVEIQDISSQILLQLLPERPAGLWLDACAGAGGKTLQLAKALQPRGAVQAFDPRSSALRELGSRVKRSGLRNIEVLENRPTETLYDGVLVDAPCSGSGTWRRHPYLMRQTRETDVFSHAERQLQILKYYAARVKPGGTLVYSTCSLSRLENENVAAQFLEARSAFESLPLAARFGYEDHGKGITVYPHDHNGDGLYVAAFRLND